MQAWLVESERVGNLRSAARLHLALSLRQGWGETATYRKQHVEAARSLSQAAGSLRGAGMFEANLECLQQHGLPFNLCEVLSLHAWMMRELSDWRGLNIVWSEWSWPNSTDSWRSFIRVCHALKCNGYPLALPLATAFLERQRMNQRASGR